MSGERCYLDDCPNPVTVQQAVTNDWFCDEHRWLIDGFFDFLDDGAPVGPTTEPGIPATKEQP